MEVLRRKKTLYCACARLQRNLQMNVVRRKDVHLTDKCRKQKLYTKNSRQQKQREF